MRAVVVLNTDSGGLAAGEAGPTPEEIRAALSERGVDAEISSAAGPLTERLRAAVAARPDVVVVGGGDGTISRAAAELAGGEIPLGILPLGTMNHFAKDAGIPVDLAAAIETIAAGKLGVFDVGEVNGRVFVNNSSIGLYARIVQERNYRRRLGHSKWLALIIAAARAVLRLRLLELRYPGEGGEVVRRTPFLLVGNNMYDLERVGVSRRQRLDGGVLSVYIPRVETRRALLILCLRAITGRLRWARDIDSFTTAALAVRTRRSLTAVAMDGEVAWMRSPLQYRIRRAALRLIVPGALLALQI